MTAFATLDDVMSVANSVDASVLTLLNPFFEMRTTLLAFVGRPPCRAIPFVGNPFDGRLPSGKPPRPPVTKPREPAFPEVAWC